MRPEGLSAGLSANTDEDKTMPKIERFNPPGHDFPGMSQAVRAGEWILVSGQVALDADGRVIGEDDAEAQAEQVFRNLRAALEAAGSKLEDVVRLTAYLTDSSAYPGYAAVKNRLCGQHPPASSVVIVSALLLPELLLEVEAVAWSA